MSSTELLVILFGLCIGYWVVSRFGSGNKGQKKQSSTQSSPDPEAQRRRAQAEPESQEQQRRQESESAFPALWYEVLNVSPNADTQEIRRAYKSLMSQYHPDKVASLGAELRELCERKTKEINTAYDRAMVERGSA